MEIIESKPLRLTPPHPSLCQCCAVEHNADEPHNWQSTYWAFWFQQEHGRSPIIEDAFERCDSIRCELWAEHLDDWGQEQDAIALRALANLKRESEMEAEPYGAVSDSQP